MSNPQRLADLETLRGCKAAKVDLREAREANQRLRDQRDRALAFLEAVVDEGTCRLDHNGNCQEHGWFDGPCGHALALALLAEVANE